MSDVLLCACSECGESDVCYGFGASSIVTDGNLSLVYVCEVCLERAIRKIRERSIRPPEGDDHADT